MSIRARLTLWYTTIFGVTLVLFGVILYYLLFVNLVQEVDHSLDQKADKVLESTQIVESLFTPYKELILPNVDVFASPDTFLQIIDSRGSIRARSDNLGNRMLPLSRETIVLAKKGKGFYETVAVSSGKVRLYNVPLIDANQIIGILQVGRSMAQVESTLLRLRFLLFMGTVITLLIAASVGYLLARAALRPINKVTKTAAEIESNEDLGRRISYSGPQDEMGKLAATFNLMLARLERVYSRLEKTYSIQQRFVADASHELRSPLTTIGGNVEFLQKLGEEDVALRQETLDDIHDEIKRMTRLVEDMLELARADAGLQLEKESTPLGSLLDNVAVIAGKRAGGVQFINNIDKIVKERKVFCNKDYLEQAFLILLDNAFKYTPSGKVVELTAYLKDDWIAVSVKDTGNGIKEADLPHVFERFYRGDAARGPGGTGLGLSIAQWIVQEHGGQISVKSQWGEGTVFTVRLPVLHKESQESVM